MTLDSYEYGLEVLDEEGRELVTLGYDDGEGPALTLEQPKSEMRAGVGVRDDWAYVAIGEDNVGGAVLGYAEETALLRLAGAHSEYMYRLYSDGNAAGLELTVNTIKDRQLQPPLARDESDPIQTVEPHDRRDAGPAAMLRISERGFEAAG